MVTSSIKDFFQRCYEVETLSDSLSSFKPLRPYQLLRIQPLLDQIHSQGMDFKYFLTHAYPYKNVYWKKTVSNNSRIKQILRKFAKYDLKCLFFIEKHKEGQRRGGYHVHVLLEDPYKYASMKPSRIVRSVLNQTYSDVASNNNYDFKDRLIRNALVKHVQSVADYEDSIRILPIGELDQRVSYCTKQFWTNSMEPSDVVDFKISNIDANIIRRSWNKNEYFRINN